MRIAELLGYPLFVVDRFPASELHRWRVKFMSDYYRANPKKMPRLTPDNVSVETSQQQLADLFGFDLNQLKSS